MAVVNDEIWTQSFIKAFMTAAEYFREKGLNFLEMPKSEEYREGKIIMVNNSSEYFSLRSMLVYILKHYKSLIIGLLIGAVLLCAFSIVRGESSSKSSTEGNNTTDEDLEDAQQDLAIAEEGLENLQKQLKTQESNLERYENELKEYEQSWAENIFIQTSASDRSAIDTVYQINGDEDSAGQILNLLDASSGSMYQAVADQLNDGKTAYNIQQLFSFEADADLYQIAVSVSDENAEGVKKIQELSRTWIEDKFNEFTENHPNAGLNLVVSEGEVYTYFDSDIFSAQQTAAEKRISLGNNISTERNNINTTKTNIQKKEKDIEEYEETVESLEKSQNNSIKVGSATIGRRDIIIYTVLGAVIGVVVVAVIYIFIFLFGRKLRDPEDMESRTGHKLLGILWQPPYRPGKDKWKRALDRWNGTDYDLNPDDQLEQLTVVLQLKMQQNEASKIVLIGTCNASDVEQVYQGIKKNLPPDVSQGVTWGEDPISSLETAQELLDADAVVLVEKVGESLVKNIRKLRIFLNNNKIQVFGGIAI